VNLLTPSLVRAAVALLALCAAASVTAQPTSGVSPIMSVIGVEPDDELTPGQKADPWESFNRAMFRFNQDLDRDLLLPWTDAYLTLLPEVARIGIGNFFANAQDIWSSANNLMQGKFERSVMMTMRFATNTGLGAFGLIDIATAVGMERWPEDFGQTLGVWGVAPGPYLVLPVFGPSTLRDALGLPLDLAASPYYAINESAFRPVTTVLGALNARAQLMSATQALDAIALDKYSFVRDAFLSRRLRLVFDGNPPDEDELKPLVKPAP
jgi:phospholipid-binding lipoprotein MlaA